MGYKSLDDYILAKHMEDIKKSTDYAQRNKQVTNFIHMHHSQNNLERFVPKIKKYDPKKLWDYIESHFAGKMVENSALRIDMLFNSQFLKAR